MQGTKIFWSENLQLQSRPSNILSTQISCLLQGIIRSYDTRERDGERQGETETETGRERQKESTCGANEPVATFE